MFATAMDTGKKNMEYPQYSSIPCPSQPGRLVCCDFDETYLPYAGNDKGEDGIETLEAFLLQNTEKLGLVLGWITGSSLSAVLRKGNGKITLLPHFIASSLGTEFYLVKHDRITESVEWTDKIYASGFRRENISKVKKILAGENISLIKQSADYQGKYMESYYFPVSPGSETTLHRIEEVAGNFSLKVLFSFCNPAAGDPEGYYDIQLIPSCCGKAEALLFAANLFGIYPQNSWAFGDSCNDLEMLTIAGNGFLVENADPEALLKFPYRVSGKYCNGILYQLNKLIS